MNARFSFSFTRRGIIAAFWGFLALAGPVNAQTYPDRAVRIVVPYATGGGADVFARVLAKNLEQLWKQGVVVENKVGASGNIGTLEVVRAAPDGYTLVLQNVSIATNYAIQGKLPYSPTADLTPILMLGTTPHAIVAHPSANVGNLKEMIAAVKKAPGSLAYGSCGVGTPHHFAMEVLRQVADLDMTHVGYRGCAPALNDVAAGQVPFAIVSANLVPQYVAAGRLKALGVTSNRRYGVLPNVPTIQEQGISDFDYVGWYALMGPARLPAPVVEKLTTSVNLVMDDPVVQKTLTDGGIDTKRASAAELSRIIVEDSARYFSVARKLNIKPE
jgi:tripartite-type tricarboxylate transporter receptor subunit TctC